MAQFDRYHNSFPSMKMSKYTVTAMRLVQVEWIKSIQPNYFVTFNFHENYSAVQATTVLNKWYCFMHQHMYKQRAAEVADNFQLAMIALPEHTQSGHIHFHSAIRVHPNFMQKFERLASKIFKARVPTASIDVQQIKPTVADLHNVAWYMTKDKFSVEPFLPDSMKEGAMCAPDTATVDSPWVIH